MTKNANTTGRKTLDKLGRDPRIERIDFEGYVHQGGDGFWAYTNDGFCNGDFGCHIIHENSASEIIDQAKRIRPCSCDDCLSALHVAATTRGTTPCSARTDGGPCVPFQTSGPTCEFCGAEARS